MEHWKPSKFIKKGGKLYASRDSAEVSVSSRLVADIVADFYARQIPKHCTGRLIDLGCGKVPLFGAYRKHVDEVVCVDWPQSPHDIDHIDYECDLSKDLPFGNEEFDTVLLSDVLEHIAEPLSLMKEVSRILRPGGTLLMNVPFLYWLHERPHDYYRYTEFALKRFATESSLHVIELEINGGAPEVIADLIAKCAKQVPLLGPIIASSVQLIAKAARNTPPGRHVSRKTSSLFPQGYCLVLGKE